MKWISIKDQLPTEYGSYIVCRACKDCLENKNHSHKMVYRGPQYALAEWVPADKTLIYYYHKRGDHSWDRFGVDHWALREFDSKEITHYMKFEKLCTL